jgi:hypothetical protein
MARLAPNPIKAIPKAPADTMKFAAQNRGAKERGNKPEPDNMRQRNEASVREARRQWCRGTCRLGEQVDDKITVLGFRAFVQNPTRRAAASERTRLTGAVRLLENDLGTALFTRRNRSVFLADAGHKLTQSVAHGLGHI